MRWLLLLLALMFTAPISVEAQNTVRRSDLTVMLDGQLYFLHTVRRKDTLYSIAAAYGVTPAQIIEKNPFAQTEIRPNQTLLIISQKKAEEKTEEKTASTQVAPSPSSPATLASPQFVDYELTYGDQGAEVEATDSVDADSTVDRITFGLTKPIDAHRPIRIAMMLPFGGARSEDNFVDFFRGASLAFDHISASGAQITIDVISTSASPDVVEQLISQGRLADADMIIGPVYADVFEIVARYATAKRIPIISPLGSAGSADNAMVVEVAPAEANRWDKLVPLFTDARSNVILVTSPTATDTAALLQLQSLLPSSAQTISFDGKKTPVNVLSSALCRDMRNVIIAPLTDESLVENLLSRFSSINVGGRSEITVVGTPRWSRFNSMNLELFFKLSVVYPTTYFFDRLDERVGEFYRNYVGRYSSLPTLYSLRAYDVMMIFGGALADERERMFYPITDGSIRVLQVPYRFVQQGDDASKIINTEWAIVQYLPSFRIEVR